MNTLNRREAVKLIDRTFKRLDIACQDSKDWPQFLKLIREEERQHRNGCNYTGVPNALPMGRAVELFAIKGVFERFVPGHSKERIYTPKAEDYFWTKHSIFAACSIAKLNRPEILKEFTRSDMRAYLDQVDYVPLNDPQQS